MSRTAAIAAIFIQLIAAVPDAAGNSLPPRKLLHALHEVQDRQAHGEQNARGMQNSILEELQTAFESEISKAELDPDAANGIFEYVLNGAKIENAHKLLNSLEKTNEHGGLAVAIRHYIDGNMQAATEYFDKMEANRIGGNLLPYVYLAAGYANLEIDAEKSAGFFQLAILTAPGTLVEEVAMRRLISIAMKTNNSNLFKRISIIYAKRYYNSLYIDQYLEAYARGATKVSLNIEIEYTIKLLNHIPKYSQEMLVTDLITMFAKQGKLAIIKKILNGIKNSKSPSGNSLIDFYQSVSPIADLEIDFSDSKKISPDKTINMSPENILICNALFEIYKNITAPLLNDTAGPEMKFDRPTVINNNENAGQSVSIKAENSAAVEKSDTPAANSEYNNSINIVKKIIANNKKYIALDN